MNTTKEEQPKKPYSKKIWEGALMELEANYQKLKQELEGENFPKRELEFAEIKK